MATTVGDPTLPLCYDNALNQEYYCNWGYSCCGTRSCCQNYSSHTRFASSQWFWFVWATMIILVCCCSYIRRRQAAGEGFLPVAFYSNRARRRRVQNGGEESEEELLPDTIAGNSVYFLPPGSGNVADSDWYRANKPPPYALSCPAPSGDADAAYSRPGGDDVSAVATMTLSSTSVGAESVDVPAVAVVVSGERAPAVPVGMAVGGVDAPAILPHSTIPNVLPPPPSPPSMAAGIVAASASVNGGVQPPPCASGSGEAVNLLGPPPAYTDS